MVISAFQFSTLDNSEKETEEEVEKGVSGMSLETEKKMMSLLSPEQIANNKLISHRIVNLIDQVKRLVNSD